MVSFSVNGRKVIKQETFILDMLLHSGHEPLHVSPEFFRSSGPGPGSSVSFGDEVIPDVVHAVDLSPFQDLFKEIFELFEGEDLISVDHADESTYPGERGFSKVPAKLLILIFQAPPPFITPQVPEIAVSREKLIIIISAHAGISHQELINLLSRGHSVEHIQTEAVRVNLAVNAHEHPFGFFHGSSLLLARNKNREGFYPFPIH